MAISWLPFAELRHLAGLAKFTQTALKLQESPGRTDALFGQGSVEFFPLGLPCRDLLLLRLHPLQQLAGQNMECLAVVLTALAVQGSLDGGEGLLGDP